MQHLKYFTHIYTRIQHK